MAKSLRSGTLKSMDQSLPPLTAEEAELLQKQFAEKEKQLRAQSDSLREKEMELIKEKEQLSQSSFDTESVHEILTELHRQVVSLKELPQQFKSLQNQVTNLQNPTISAQTIFNETYTHRPTLIGSSPVPPANPSPTQANSPNYVEPSPIRLKDVMDSIPTFDGQRMSIFQFSKHCERALDLIPSNQEPYLVQLIMNKLTGHAYIAIEGQRFNSVASLIRKLKQIFGPNKSLNQYKGELGNAYMKPNDSIFDYIERIKELRTAIIDGELDLYGKLDDWTLENIDKDVLESFINGLPSQLLIRVKIESYKNLDDAFMKTIQLSKTLEIESLRRKASFEKQSNLTTLARQDSLTDIRPSRDPSPSRQNSDYQPRSILTRTQAPFIKPLIPGQPGPNFPSGNICKFCRISGHATDNCRKLDYRNSFIQSTNPSGPKPQAQDETIIPENLPRGPDTSDVRRDATEQAGRQSVQSAVRFQEKPITIA